MTTLRRSFLLSALAFALLPLAARAQIEAYHDQTSAQHQLNFSQFSQKGYRMLTLTIYGTIASPRYAAVWIKRAGPGFVGFHDQTGAQYQALINLWAPQGYTPRILTAMGTLANPRIAGVFEKTGAQIRASHGLSETEFITEFKKARDEGFRIATADVYGTTSDPRYIVSFEKNTEGEGLAISAGNADYQTHFDAFADTWARPVLVGFSDAPRFLSIWRNDSVGLCHAHHDMTSAQYQALFTAYIAQDFYPISLQASGSDTGARFAAVWAKTDLPLPRAFQATGQAVPELAAFDGWAQSWMKTADCRAMALAVVKDARLVFARGYTFAESGYPVTQPASLFRIASCNKPLTSIAIHQDYEIQPGQIGPQSKMTGFLNPTSVLDGWNDVITVDHLLTHQGGFNRDVSFDPMFRDTTVATTLSKSLPISKRDIFDYMTQNVFLDFYPGTDTNYSNYGFSMLGQILERLNPGKTYAQVLQKRVFDPLGLTRPFVGGSLKSQIHPDEVPYHPKNPYIAKSVNSAIQPWVAGQYGGWNQPNMDSHGAYVMAAPDYAKVLAAFDLGNSNPLLAPASTAAMWSVAPNTTSYLRGWKLRTVDGPTGKVDLYNHGGKLDGTGALIAHRSDGISFAFFTNSDSIVSVDDEGEQINRLLNGPSRWPAHDLFPSVGIPAFGKRVAGGSAPYGTSCGSASAPPRLSGSGTPEIGARVGLDLTGAPASTIAAICLIGTAKASLPLDGIGAPGCTLWAQPTLVVPVNLARGTATLPLDLPRDRALVGQHLYGQYVLMATGSNPLTTTNGLDIVIGGFSF